MDSIKVAASGTAERSLCGGGGGRKVADKWEFETGGE